jgi:hypothetical protein
MFVLALKMAVLVSMCGNVGAGRLPGLDAIKTAPAARVVLALLETTALGSSLPSVVCRVGAGSRYVSALEVDWP